jgi:hypothetical protein
MIDRMNLADGCADCGEEMLAIWGFDAKVCPECFEKDLRVRNVTALEDIAKSLRVIAGIKPEPVPEVPARNSGASGAW